MYIVCPLCRLRSHLNRFKPEEFEETIELIEMRSQGRARGWKEIARFSALDDEELMTRIAARCRIILKLIGEEVTTLEDTELEEELRDRIEEFEDENTELKGSVDEYEEEMDGLLVNVNQALPDDYEAFNTLEAALKALIREYRKAMEEAEDEDYDDDEDDKEDDDNDDDDEGDPLSEIDKELLIAEREGLIEKI